MKRMPTLSIRQPWAWLIVNGYKDIENRDWRTSFRGRVLIHAGKTLTRKYFDEITGDLQWAFPGRTVPSLPNYDAMERGGIVGIATITDCVSDSRSPWFGGPYGFTLKDASPLPFFAVNGKLGFFDVDAPDELIAAIGRVDAIGATA